MHHFSSFRAICRCKFHGLIVESERLHFLQHPIENGTEFTRHGKRTERDNETYSPEMGYGRIIVHDLWL